MFRPAVVIIRIFSLQNTFKIVLYNLRAGVLKKRSRHQYFVYGYCSCIGGVGKSFGQYIKVMII